tara:strand:- start:1178 stop:1735 length:558 start_codon:yes stop_codon:yes gene_type:complete
MPNWCWNHLTVTGDEKELQEFVEKSTNAHKETEFSFEGTLPRGDRKDWYNWSIDNWGTKWDACAPNICHNDIDYFAVSFESAWSPPINWINNIMQDFPDLRFELEYEEPGMCFGGRLRAQQDYLWEDDNWDLDQASECCEGEINWDHEDFEHQCLICGDECETITMNVADIKPAKIKINENKKDR